MSDWEAQIRNSTDAEWKATKFIKKLKEHQAKYPEFIVERPAEYFSNQTHKVQGGLAYADIAALTQNLRKGKYRTEDEYAAIGKYKAEIAAQQEEAAPKKSYYKYEYKYVYEPPPY